MSDKLLTITLLALFICSCEKDKMSEAEGSWTVLRTGNVEYNLQVEATTRQEIDGYKVLTATSTEDTSAPKSISFWFKDWPLSSGSYRPVEFFENHELGDKQVGVTLAFPGKDTLYSTGLKYVGFAPDPAEDIIITSDNGKLTINVPMMSSWTVTDRYLDSAYYKGMVKER